MIIKKFILVRLPHPIILNKKNEDRKNLYINRHKKNESKFWNKSGIDTPSFWARFLLWEKPTINESYEYIKKKFNI